MSLDKETLPECTRHFSGAKMTSLMTKRVFSR